MAIETTTQGETAEQTGAPQAIGHPRRRAAECTTVGGVARGLGWFSIGLGLAEVLTPGLLARMIGVRERRTTMRLFGVREIAAGIGILAQRKPAGWLWARVGGDLLDLGSLGMAMASHRQSRGRIAAATGAVAGVTALDILCARELSIESGLLPAGDRELRLSRTIIVNRSAAECYAFWRDLQNLPRFMSHLESVRTTGENRTHWVASAPAGMRIEWDSEVVDDRRDELIAWRSLAGSAIDNAGSVRFEPAPGGRGTLVRVSIYYMPPARGIGTLLGKLFGQDPEQQVGRDLRRFKQLLETGEIPTTEGQPAGRRRSATWLDELARA